MQRPWILVALGCAAVLSSAAVARAQEPELATKEHEIFKHEVGSWDAAVKTYFSPDGKPTESKATETNRLLAGGMWIISDFKGEFAGQPFAGHGQYGYDRAKKKYVGTWIDSMGSSMLVMEGAYDEKTKTLSLAGKTTDYSGKVMEMKTSNTYKDDGTRFSTIYMKSDETGPEFVKLMETTYTKRAEAGSAK